MLLSLTCLIEFHTLLEKRIMYRTTYYNGWYMPKTNKTEDGDFLEIAINKCQPNEPCVPLLIKKIFIFIAENTKCEKDMLDGISDFDYIFHQSEKFKKLLDGYTLVGVNWPPLKVNNKPMLFLFKKS